MIWRLERNLTAALAGDIANAKNQTLKTMIVFFIPENETHSLVSNFGPFPENLRLPAPLNQSFGIKIIIAILLTVDLLFGFAIRRKLTNYLQSKDSKQNPINYFFWIDQINGIFLGLNIIFTLVTILTPFPISDIIGYELCNWVDIFGCIYLAGTTVWSFHIALLR